MPSPKSIKIYQVKGSTSDLDFLHDLTSPLVERLIDSTHHLSGGSDIASENRLKKSRGTQQLQSEEESPSLRHDLSSTSVDSVSVKVAVIDVKPHSSHVLVTEHTCFARPLEGRNHRFFDFVHELDSLSGIDDHVGTSILRTETPDLDSVFLLPFELFHQPLTSGLGVHSRGDFSLLNQVGKLFSKRSGRSEDLVVLVLGLGHTFPFFMDD